MTYAVRGSPDLARVLALPWRDWRAGLGGRHGTTDQNVELLSKIYGRSPNARLRPVQADALVGCHDWGGGLVLVRVGGGKTLISFLAPLVCEAKRPLLIVPAKLRDKTVRDWRRLCIGMDEDGKTCPHGAWIMPALAVYRRPLYEVLPGTEAHGPTVGLCSYTRLSRQGDIVLGEYEPDMIIADECHALANRKTALWRSIQRYRAKNDVRFLGLSGTVAKRSIADWAHLAEWGLGHGSPLPLKRGVTLEWASFLDPAVEVRPQPGQLVRLVAQRDYDELRTDPVGVVRRAFGARVAHTPGVVVSRDDGPGCSLSVRSRYFEICSEPLQNAIRECRDRWRLPDGQLICDPPALSRHLRELACGFYYRWIKQPPDEWLEARRAWCAFARDVIQRSRRGLDTEARVFAACRAPSEIMHCVDVLRGRHRPTDDLGWAKAIVLEAWQARNRPPRLVAHGETEPRLNRKTARWAADALGDDDVEIAAALQAARNTQTHPDPDGIWRAWSEIRAVFDPVTEPVWISDELCEHAAAWLHETEGLCWVQFVAAGKHLSEIADVPYFRQKGRATDGLHLEAHTGAAICSIDTCAEGLNLQAWHKNLIMTPPRAGRTWEQLLGRTHRDGQTADLVEAEVLSCIAEHYKTLALACDDALFLQQSLGQPQKLIYSDVEFESPKKPPAYFG